MFDRVLNTPLGYYRNNLGEMSEIPIMEILKNSQQNSRARSTRWQLFFKKDFLNIWKYWQEKNFIFNKVAGLKADFAILPDFQVSLEKDKWTSLIRKNCRL